MFDYLGKNWIAIVSLIVAVFVLYMNYLSGFQLVIRDVGRIQIAKNPFSPGLTQPSFILDLLFSNRGAKIGVVEDIAISLNNQGKSTIFRTLLVITDRSKSFQKELIPPKAETFTAFELGKESSLVKQLLFVPIESDSTTSFATGTYNADIWVLASNSHEWTKKQSIVFTITAEDVQALANSTITPQSGGGYFIKWVTQDKPLQSTEENLRALKEKISMR